MAINLPEWTLAMEIKQIARAFILIAKANHYMIGFCYAATLEELEKAKQVLIVWSNAADNKDKDLELALDLIEQEIKGVEKIGVR